MRHKKKDGKHLKRHNQRKNQQLINNKQNRFQFVETIYLHRKEIGYLAEIDDFFIFIIKSCNSNIQNHI